jgi:hypothetical protein
MFANGLRVAEVVVLLDQAIEQRLVSGSANEAKLQVAKSRQGTTQGSLVQRHRLGAKP